MPAASAEMRALLSSAGNVSIGDTLFAEIEDREEGEIGGDAILAFQANNLTVGNTANFQILNGLSDSEGNGAGGSIGGDATIGVQLASLTAPILVGDIDNTGGGSIGGDAIVSFNIDGNVVSTTVATFGILNNANGVKAVSGSIGGEALISFITGGNFTTNTLAAFIDNRNGGSIGTAASILFNIGGTLMTTGDALFQISGGFDAGRLPSLPAGGPPPLPPITSIEISADEINVGGSLTAKILDQGNSTRGDDVTIHSDGDITVGNDFNIDGTVTADGNIDVTNILSLPQSVSAGGSISAGGVFAFTLSAVDDISVGYTGGQGSVGLFVDTLTAGGTLHLLNASNFTNESATSFGDIGFTPDDMTITVGSIMSVGPTIPPLVANGFDADPNFGHDNPGNGGMVTLDLTNGNLTIGSESDLNYISANGGLFAVDSEAGGNGGTVNIMATGDVTLNDGDNGAPAISATSGFIPQNGPFTLGEGGTVNIDASGTITVNSTIVVSSDEIPKVRPSGSIPAGRRSASGGNISLTSHNSGSPLTQNVVAINLGDSSQLLSLLDSDAAGPGGAITILATGANSDANINGEVEADRGTIDIRNNGNSGRAPAWQHDKFGLHARRRHQSGRVRNEWPAHRRFRFSLGRQYP